MVVRRKRIFLIASGKSLFRLRKSAPFFPKKSIEEPIFSV